MAHYLVPPNGASPVIAPSLNRKERGVGTGANSETADVSKCITNGITNGTTNSTINGTQDTPHPYDTGPECGNPTVIPTKILESFHFTFLIRHPCSSIPSYYRCTVAPLDKVTGFYDFMPSEAGYEELRRLFDYLRSIGQVGPGVANRTHHQPTTNGYTLGNRHTSSISSTDGTMTTRQSGKVDICIVDADDLLDNPNGVIEAFCKSVGIDYNERMLNWNTIEDQQYARESFKKWAGFHEDALNSCDFKPRTHVSDYFIPITLADALR